MTRSYRDTRAFKTILHAEGDDKPGQDWLHWQGLHIVLVSSLVGVHHPPIVVIAGVPRPGLHAAGDESLHAGLSGVAFPAGHARGAGRHGRLQERQEVGARRVPAALRPQHDLRRGAHPGHGRKHRCAGSGVWAAPILWICSQTDTDTQHIGNMRVAFLAACSASEPFGFIDSVDTAHRDQMGILCARLARLHFANVTSVVCS